MDQIKIGKFLKELRKEKGITQEQMAEQLLVSNRTVSRWENGNNMPDLDILIEISDYYEVDLRELLNGERKSGNMDKEIKETVLEAADYTNTEGEKVNRRVRLCNVVALLLMVIYMIIRETSIYSDSSAMLAIADFVQGASLGILLVGIICSSRYGAKIRAFKKRIIMKS